MAAVRLSSPGLATPRERARGDPGSPLPREARKSRSPSAFRSPSRPRWSRSSKTARRSDMANIGSFKKSGQELQGEIVTLSLQTKGVRIVPETDQTSDIAPSHRVYVGRAEIGAAWSKRSPEGRDYLSVKL